MNREVAIRLISAVIAAIGAWILLQSTFFGLQAFSGLVARHSGGMTGSEVDVAYQSSVAAFRTLGAVLLGVGLLRALQPFPKDK